MPSKRKEICDLLTQWILETKAGVEREKYAPSRDPDSSDDSIRDGEVLLVKLRDLRTAVEEL